MIFYIPVVHALVIFPVVEMDFPDLPFYSFLLYDVHLHTHAHIHTHTAEGADAALTWSTEQFSAFSFSPYKSASN